ncbi:alpha-2-macroglobulin family protein [gut metagenome]|uniref:Alpha-2-macroglobulin family protein n=1 Tax=gut metagenome TaxID=749906 RepID=J9FI69_9ZZZZ
MQSSFIGVSNSRCIPCQNEAWWIGKEIIMKKIQRLLVVGVLLWGSVCATMAQSYDNLWKQMEQARDKSLPQTMIQVVDRIVQKAEREQNAPQLMKATVYGEFVQRQLTPDSLYAGIRHLEQWVSVEKNPVNRAILYALLADRYADAMWKSDRLNETLTDLDMEEVPADVREWTGNLFARKVDALCKASLQDEEALLEASSKDYQPFVVLGDESRYYVHDMYHLLARRALKKYQSLGEYLPDSLRYVTISGIYERMATLYAHRSGCEEAALLTALDWVKQLRDEAVRKASPQRWPEVEKEAGRRYVQQLDSLIDRYGTQEICAEAYIRKASWLKNVRNGSLLDCLQMCEEGLKRYPKYRRINELKDIRQEVEHPLLAGSISSQIYPGDTLSLRVEYRNLKGFMLHLYRTSYAEIPQLKRELDETFIRQNGTSIFTKHLDLQPNPKNGRPAEEWKYLRSDTLIKVKAPDETGVYLLQMVPDGVKAPLKAGFFVTSRFCSMILNLKDERREVVVLDGRTGHPVVGAEVLGYNSYYRSPNEKVLQRLITNAEGKVLFTEKDIHSYKVSKGKDVAMLRQQAGVDVVYGNGQEESVDHLCLLTDRAVYRPGQTVYVKGVAYRQKGWKAEVLKNASYELLLLDVNRKKVASRKLMTNDFGSFTTEFVLPAACLNGMFLLQSQDRKGLTRIRVEEYKRPTFEIDFLPIENAYCLGEQVLLKGVVKAFSGRSVQEMPLAYTLKRTTLQLMPGSVHQGGEETLKHDTVMLDAQGRFEIPVQLPVFDKKMPLAYRYVVEATVTDEGGETQMATHQFGASRDRYEISVGLPYVLCKEDTLRPTVRVTNADGVEKQVSGQMYLYTDDAKMPVWKGTFRGNQKPDFSSWSQLPSGKYRLQLTVRDSLNREQTYPTDYDREISFMLFSKNDRKLPVFTDIFYRGEQEEFDATQPAVWYFGTSHRDAYVLMDVFNNHRRIESRVLQLSDTLMRMEYPYQEAYGKGLTVQFTFVKNGHVYEKQVLLTKKQPKHTLDLTWSVFRDRLRPGQEETWQLTVKKPDGLPAAAEMLAMLYDASLDQIYGHYQQLKLHYDYDHVFFDREWNQTSWMSLNFAFPWQSYRVPGWTYDTFFTPMGITEVLQIVDDAAPVVVRGYRPMLKKTLTGRVNGADLVTGEESYREESGNAVEVTYVPVQVSEEIPESQPVLDLVFEEEVVTLNEGMVTMPEVRKNFAETAFFYPQLRTNEQGEIVFTFTLPESLTRWNFRGYAHTRDMMTGQLDAEVVTTKEFMVQPHFPRFLRVGDHTQLSATLSNLTGKALKGTLRWILFDPATDQVIQSHKQKFSAEAGRNVALYWKVEADERYPLLGVRVVAEGGSFSDGEQLLLPVLSNQMYITETLPLTVRGGEQKECSLDQLFNGHHPQATDRRLIVEFTGNPAWYAVQALPSLGTPASDNATGWAATYYANTLASFIAQSQPKIQAMITQWKSQGGGKETFLSQLEKNPELKNILLSESPWVLEATTEAEQRARIALLFDLNQLKDRNYVALSKLKELQHVDGAWSWYKGMYPNLSMTLYVTELLVRLPLLIGKELEGDALVVRRNAFNYLHLQLLKEYRERLKAEREGAVFTTPSAMALDYLYLIALSGEKVPDTNRKAYAYFMDKVGGLLTAGNLAEKSRAAVILWKSGRKSQAQDFIASLREHLIQEPELGAHFAFLDEACCWGMMPIQVHVGAMEAFCCVDGEILLLEEMKLWLLKQKQSTCWSSSVATADAVYALLMQGHDLLADSGEVRIALGNKVLNTTDASAAMSGLNYVKETFTAHCAEVDARQLTVDNRSNGMAWGAIYAQYLIPMSEVQQQGGSLSIQKQLFVERSDVHGHLSLQPLGEKTALKPGDKVVSRLVMKLDRAMDFIQLKDQRGACFEPLSSLSGYRWMNGLGTYVEVEDAATNFFFDHLDKGVYVLENAYRIVRNGRYAAGIATVQSAYAPEFAAHSNGITVICE